MTELSPVAAKNIAKLLFWFRKDPRLIDGLLFILSDSEATEIFKKSLDITLSDEPKELRDAKLAKATEELRARCQEVRNA